MPSGVPPTPPPAATGWEIARRSGVHRRRALANIHASRSTEVTMPFISVTRLKVRSVRFLPSFVIHTLRSVRQVKEAQGFRDGALLIDRHWTFWTMTSWDNQDNVRSFMRAGSHWKAMPHLLDWCDEATVVHWDQSETGLPSWPDASQRMRESGRPSKVRFPSPHHGTLSFPSPRVIAGASIAAKRPN